ncbi:hypothetical protein BDV10DRAFT_153674 [Aspergillus recurvatus]
MSNQPIPPAPPYWGANYTQQWTPQPPPSSGSMPRDLQFNPDPSFDSQQYHNFNPFYANAHLPGLGGADATGTFPPPPFAFPGTFPPAAGAHPFATMPNMGYPLMPLPSGPSQMPPSQPSTNDMDHSANLKASDHNPTSTTNLDQDLDREEGELTDIEGHATTEQQQPHSLQNAQPPRANHSGSQGFRRAGCIEDDRARFGQSQLTGSKAPHAKDERAAVVSTSRRESLSELEEGEASPGPPASSRASGSPYNPPMPTNALSPPTSKPLAEASKPASEEVDPMSHSVPASTDSKVSPGSAVSLAQLRVQAQGALLSLAPHSIRYSELIGEGINPTLLKQLYEDVGIKVPTTPPADSRTKPGSKETTHARADATAASGQAKQPTKQVEPQLGAAQTATSSEPSFTPPQSVLGSTTKPMERKEVIARMLAAKAAKSSPAAPPSDAMQAAPSVRSTPAIVEKSTVSTPSQDSAANVKETRLREKNKAQTELARQRIEQLKKQGLMRNLQKSQSDSDKEQGIVQESPQPQNSTIVQHPLPERPPLPQSASVDYIPGLFMTEQVPLATNGAHITPVQDLVSQSATHSRSSQRKRPRASDFDDDPVPVPKKVFSNGTNHQIPPERLIIDISDDEFYDEDEGSMDAESTLTGPSKDSGPPTAEGLPRVYPAPAGNLPHRPATSQSYSFSTSSTPNNHRSSEQDDLRKKDLEIQAMHRKIAELEQRKKAKLASRTQSPRASDSPTLDIVSTPAVPAPPLLPAPPTVPDKKVEDVLAVMDADKLRKMKSKILRTQEIEAGVPSLDAVIRKTEMKLADTRKEIEELSSELAKGKEGRQHLIEELNALKLEVAGLSLEHVNAALSTMEAKKELPVEAVQAPTSDNEVADERVKAVPDVSEADALTQKDTASFLRADPIAPSSPSAKDRSNTPNVVKDAPNLNATAEELTDTSMSDSSSSMDESSDDSSSQSGSLNEEMPDAPEPNTGSVAPADEVNTIPQGLSNGPEKLGEEPLPGNQPPNTQPTNKEDLGADSENLASPESPVSEAYEPPEPEDSANVSDSSYSPAPSPDSHSSAPKMEISGSSEGQSTEAGEPLTKRVQELDFQQSSQLFHIGPLDNSRRPEDSHRKLTTYTSPLKLFRAYRYHPNYNDDVSGGYRSLTYSHNIDPLKHLCPFETSGGVCNDRSCEFQHFRDMALSDDKILIQMGSVREGKTTEESDKYVAGLKEAINDMRRDKVKDFNTVAAEIVAYRRRFLQDPTRVLAL